MRVVDTSAWVEWFSDTDTASRLEPHLPEQADCIVPTMVQLELAKWLGRERLGETDRKALAYLGECLVMPLSTQLALLSAEMCRTHRLSTADAVIYATAVATDSDLLTCDAHFEGLPQVLYVPKA
jgi:predicted nucleic acid-binding protein